MNAFVFDIEADGLLEDATTIHCLVYSNGNDLVPLTYREDIVSFLSGADILIGHNIVRYDVPLLEKLLGIEIKAKLVDTLALSWYLHPEKERHGLEWWGVDFGIPKPKITDWQNLSTEEYVHRCTEDVKINQRLWNQFKKHLTLIYEDWEKAVPFIDYLSFKMDCAREQERSKWKLDKAYALETVERLTKAREEKLAGLVAAMPSVPTVRVSNRPPKPFKKDGTLSVAGAKWFNLLQVNNLTKDYDGVVEEIISTEPGNPASHTQLKDWLFSMGWKPQTFKFKRDEKTGKVRQIPQVNLEHGAGLCPSVLRLHDKNPAIELLDKLGIISHRLSILRGFLDYAGDSDYVAAEVQGFTNTLRFKHKTVVNLPKVGADYGEEIRGCLIAEDGEELCGSDMASLEDRLKQHYIYPHDPEYVKEMNIDGYDPHLSLALLAGEVSEEQVRAYVTGTNKSIKPIRDIFKNGNYACQYGAMPPRLALTANINLAKAKQVWETYWKKNWAIKKVAEEQRIKIVRGQMWLFNPVSHFWYSLRNKKDVFSTLVQGTAAYVFDEWVRIFRAKRPQLTGQFHDEVVLSIKIGFREAATKLLKGAIETLNEQLNLNRRLDVDVQFGNRYSEIH